MEYGELVRKAEANLIAKGILKNYTVEGRTLSTTRGGNEFCKHLQPPVLRTLRVQIQDD